MSMSDKEIDEHKHTERARDLLRDAIDSLTEGFALYDKNHRLTIFNERYREMNELLSDIIKPGLPYETLLREMARRGSLNQADSDEEKWVKRWQKNVLDYEQDNEITHSDGRTYRVAIHPTKLGGFVVIRTDITDKKRMEEEDRQTRHELQDAIESLKEGFALYDEDRCLVMFNQRYKMMNKGVSDILQPGLDWEILLRETARRGIYADAVGNEERWVSERLINGVEFIQDYELNETDGRTYLVSVHPTKLGGFVVTREDITEKKQAEVTEREGDFLIRTVLDSSTAIVTMSRIGDGQILYRSPAASEFFGNTRSAKEHFAYPEDRADLITQLLTDAQVNDFRTNCINKKGKIVAVTISSRLVDYKGEEVVVTNIVDLTEQLEADALVRQVLESCPAPIQMTSRETGELLYSSFGASTLNRPAKIERSYFSEPDGREKFLQELRENNHLQDHKAEFYDENGKKFWGAVSANLIEYQGQEVVVSSTRDLTDELAIQEELTKQREMLFQNEKMSALGELLAGVAHELNNPLSVVVGHSLMMREEITDPDLMTRVEKIGKAAERCAKIVKTFLAMARQKPKKIEDIDVNLVVETASDVTGYGSKSGNIEISSDMGKDLPAIAADADQLTQVVINLIINSEQAIKSSNKGDKINISTRFNKADNRVEICVEDNGPGIPNHIKARIFEPFFTTKEVGEGTGIGLAFCHRIILSHGGNIHLDTSEMGKTRFVISMPVAQNLSPIPETGAKGSSFKNVSLRALVLDDEVEVGELTAEILRKEGIEVDFTESGGKALNLLREQTYDIFLSDLNMPGVDGNKIYETLVSEFPHMLDKTAFVTGDTMGDSSQKLLRDSGFPYIEKPGSPSDFRELIAKLIKVSKGRNYG